MTDKTRNPDKPWMTYRKPDGTRDKLYEPGWPGDLGDDEVERLQQALSTDPDLAYWWGWRPSMKRRAVETLRRVALHGDPDCREHNRRLVREAGRHRPEPAEGRPKAGNESDSVKVTKLTQVSPPRCGTAAYRKLGV